MIRFFLQHQPVLLQRLFFLSVLQQPVTHHHMVVHVVRMTVGEVFQRFVFLVGLTEYGIDPHLRECQSFITPFQCLHQLEGREHLLVVFLLVIQLQQDIQHIDAVLIVGIQSFIGLHRLIELS